MNQIFGLFLIIMVFAFGAFFIQSGQLGSLNFGRISFGVPLESLGKDPVIKFNPPGGSPNTSGGSESSGSGGGGTSGGGVSAGLPPGTGTAFTPSGIRLPSMPAGSPTTRFSDFYGRIKLGTVSPGSPSRQGQVSLRAVFQSGEKVNVTGWYLKARNGGWYVPQAVNVYDPSGLAAPSDIYLGRGEVLNMYTTKSPVGVNFRLNLCTGYLNNYHAFNPTLPRQCPGADKATLRNFSSRCQDYVPGAVSSCREVKGTPPLANTDDSCRAYLQNFSFRGCFSLYRSEPSFLKPEWRVWMGSTFLDPRHDRFFLLDNNGHLVDWKEY